MPTPSEVKAVSAVLADEGNAELTADQVAERVWAVVEKLRRRPFRYVVIAQSRRRAADGSRAFYPTWVRGPFYTAAEGHSAAQEERARLKASEHLVHNKTGTASVMVAQVFELDQEVNPDELPEVAL